MTNIELLIEAIECSGDDWWAELEDVETALKVINGALKETPEEHEVAIILSLLEPEDNEFENSSPLQAHRKCLKKLRKNLKEIKNDLQN